LEERTAAATGVRRRIKGCWVAVGGGPVFFVIDSGAARRKKAEAWVGNYPLYHFY
jgi:hypothetical protein